MSHKVKFGVFIGRFQVPMPHAGHRVAIAQAATQSEHLIILVGSANACPSIKNPWDVKFRMAAIRSMMHQQGFKNYTVLPLNDYPYTDDQWTSDVRQTVKSVSGDAPVTLFGYDKDSSTYYLKLFPDWNYREVQSSVVINATEIREQMFNYNSAVIPVTVREDWEYYTKTEPEQFKNYPYPDTLNFNCGDALAVCLGHIVLIKRIRAPGRGCWALPGGFKNNNETFFECALRELEEETNIKVPNKVLRGSVVSTKLFDSPKRSFGIPRNTLAVHFDIKPNPDGTLPKVRAADDAAEVKWVPIDYALNDLILWEDHSAIISSMLNVTPRPAYLTM